MFAFEVATFSKMQLDEKLKRINYRHIISLTYSYMRRLVQYALKKMADMKAFQEITDNDFSYLPLFFWLPDRQRQLFQPFHL